jgi:hypothetical protein
MMRVLALLVLLLPLPAASAALEDFFGSYVGEAEVDENGVVERRHMDIVIAPHGRHGFRISWINVTLVDGRRDLPGVRRRVEEVIFQPEGGLFVAAEPATPFRTREAYEPLRGDPVRWAELHGDRLLVHSFVVLDDGRYELQTYIRELTDAGLDLVFERILDGEVVRRISGRTVRAD